MHSPSYVTLKIVMIRVDYLGCILNFIFIKIILNLKV